MFINGIYYQEYAKLEYGQMLWRNPAARERLLRHWRDPRFPPDPTPLQRRQIVGRGNRFSLSRGRLPFSREDGRRWPKAG